MPTPKHIDFAIITILDVERDAVFTRFQFENKPISPPDSTLTFFEKQFNCSGGRSYSVILTKLFSAGNSNAASQCRDIFKYYRPSYLILLGIGGNIKGKDLQIGDVAVSNKIFYYEYAKLYTDREEARSTPIECSRILVSKVKDVLKQREHFDDRGKYLLQVGVIASGDKVVADLAFQQKLQIMNKDVIAIDMESAGISTALKDENVSDRFIVIRGISDNADGTKNDAHHSIASERASEICYQLLDMYPVKANAISSNQQCVNVELLSEYIDKTIARLKSERVFENKMYGLGDKAESILEQLLSNEIEFKFFPDDENKSRIIIGERGQGKSMLLTRMFVEKGKEFLIGTSSTFPIFFNSDEIKNGIEQTVNTLLKNFDSTIASFPKPLLIIIDSLDELDYAASNKVLMEVNFLAGYYSQIYFVIASRPLMQVPQFADLIEVPKLQKDQITGILKEIAGTKAEAVYFDRLPYALKECLCIPLYAILFGGYLRDSEYWRIDSPYELINFIFEKTLSEDQKYSEEKFAKLAIYLYKHGLSRVHYGALFSNEDRLILISSGLVKEIQNELFFPLAIARDWFVARSFLSGLFDLSYFTSVKISLYNWLEPLKIAVIISTYPILLEIFKIVCDRDAGIAYYILNEAIRHRRSKEDAQNTPKINTIDFWEGVTQCTKIWIHKINRDLALLIAPIDETGVALRPLAVKQTSETWGENVNEFFWFGWYKKNDRNPDLPLSLDDVDRTDNHMGGNFDILFGASLNPAPYDFLINGSKYLHHMLEKAINNFSFVYALPEAVEELVWGTALSLLNLDPYNTGSIPLSEIEEVLKNIHNQKANRRGLVEHIDLLKNQVMILKNKQIHTLENYAPTNASWNKKGVINESADLPTLIDRTGLIMERAIMIYKRIVEKYFKGFIQSMNLYQLLPFKFSGKVTGYRTALGQMTFEHLRLGYCTVPLEMSKSFTVSISQHSGNDTWFGLDNYEEMRSVLQRLDVIRPESYNWVSIHAREETLEIFSHYPAIDYALKWLSWDLKRLHWVKKEYETEWVINRKKF